MNEEYQSFVNSEMPEIDYDSRDLEESDYSLIVRCNKTNPDCQKKIEDEESKGRLIRTVELNSEKHGKNMIDIWRRIKLKKID